jgi:hypothetical protein
MSIALQAREGMTEAALTVPEKLREEISKPAWQGWWLAAFQTRLQRGERDAVRLYPELLKMVGAQDEMIDLARRALGVASMAQAQSLIGMARDAQGMTDAELVAKSVAFLREAGWKCLPPEAQVATATDGTNGHAT